MGSKKNPAQLSAKGERMRRSLPACLTEMNIFQRERERERERALLVYNVKGHEML